MATPKKPKHIDMSVFDDEQPETPRRPKQNPELIGDGWFVKNSQGEVYGPYDWNDIGNYVVQRRISLDFLLLHKTKSKGQWVAVSRIPQLVELMSQQKKAEETFQSIVPLVSKTQSTGTGKGEFDRSSSVTILISAISNIVIGLVWASTCFGIVLAIPMWIFCIFEFIHYSKSDSMPLRQYRENATMLGVFGIIVGLANTVALVCGIITLINRPKLK